MTVELFYDYASPYSFLANESLAAKLPDPGPPGGLQFRPVYLRGFETFKNGIPYGAARLSYMIVDLRRCAAELGVEMRVPAVFPVNGLHALRGAIAAQRGGTFAAYHQAIFRATWQQGRDISSKEALAALAKELGFPDIVPLLDDRSIKDELEANTDEAIRRGVFGVPTFFAGAEMFWGHDRMHQLATYLSKR